MEPPDPNGFEKSQRGGVRPGAGRPKGSKSRISVGRRHRRPTRASKHEHAIGHTPNDASRLLANGHDLFDHLRLKLASRAIPRPVKELSAVDVMQHNMEFYHFKAAAMLESITDIARGGVERTHRQDVQFAAALLYLDAVRMMERAENCARDIARYTHRPKAPEPFSADEKKGEPAPAPIDHPPLDLPEDDAVAEAFRRAAAGLPPLPRTKL